MTTQHRVDNANMELMTVEQIASETGLTVRKVRGLIKSGFFPRAEIPGKLLHVLRSDVEKALGVAR